MSPKPRTDAERYQWLRVLLCGLKWNDTPLEPVKPEDAKYITPSGLNKAIDAAIEREATPDTRHAYEPHRKYPWFCASCGYAEHEPLMHFQPKRSADAHLLPALTKHEP